MFLKLCSLNLKQNLANQLFSILTFFLAKLSWYSSCRLSSFLPFFLSSICKLLSLLSHFLSRPHCYLLFYSSPFFPLWPILSSLLFLLHSLSPSLLPSCCHTSLAVFSLTRCGPVITSARTGILAKTAAIISCKFYEKEEEGLKELPSHWYDFFIIFFVLVILFCVCVVMILWLYFAGGLFSFFLGGSVGVLSILCCDGYL